MKNVLTDIRSYDRTDNTDMLLERFSEMEYSARNFDAALQNYLELVHVFREMTENMDDPDSQILTHLK